MTVAGIAPKRYFLTAANESDKIAVVDSKERELVELVDVGSIPPTPAVARTSLIRNTAPSGLHPIWATTPSS